MRPPEFHDMVHQPVPEFTTIPEAFFRRVDGPDDGPALKCKRAGAWVDIALSEVRQAVIDLAAGLEALGVRAGDPVGLISENRPEWLYCDYALMTLGAVNVPVYPTLTPNLIEFILKDCSAGAVVVSTRALYDKLRSVRANLPLLRAVVVIEDEGIALDPGDVGMRELCRRAGADPGREARVRAAAAKVRPGDLASLIYTSGTTGQPKGVMLTHDNFASNIQGALAVIGLTGCDRALSLLPLCHSFERLVDYICFFCRVTIAYAEAVDKAAENLLEVRPTVMAGVPRLYEKVFAKFLDTARANPLGKLLVDDAVAVARAAAAERMTPGAPAASGWTRLKHKLYDALMYKKLRAKVGGRIRFFISGGAALAKEHALFFAGAGLPIVEGYGLSETSPVITLSPLDAPRAGSPGKLIPGVEAKLAPDGELLTRSRSVMKGYFNQPEKTAEVIVDGWFHTGDVGHFDADGYLFITDRKKDLLKTSQGKYVAPQHVEAVLKKSKYIAEAAVFGDAKKYVAALLVPDYALCAAEASARGWPADRGALVKNPRFLAFLQTEVDRVQIELPSYEQIKKFALLEKEFTLEAGELTPTMKVKRKVVAEKYRALIEPLFED